MENNITHFTNFDGFKGILKSQLFWPRYNPEEVTHEMKTWFTDEDDRYNSFHIPMICFCDSDVNVIEHTKIYGCYGISFSKNWAIRKVLCPVMYIHRGSEITSILHKMFLDNADKYGKSKDEERNNALKNHKALFWISLFTKPYEGHYTKINDNKVYYTEREWRYIPKLSNDQTVSGKNIDMINQRNEQVKKFPLRFNLDDIEQLKVFHKNQKEVECFLEDNNLDSLINKIEIIKTKKKIFCKK